MSSPEPVLERSVGITQAVGFGLGAMVGTGVFVTTGVAAGMAGPAMLAAGLLWRLIWRRRQ